MTSTELFGEDICVMPLGTCPFQPGPRDEVVASLRAGGAFADVGKISVFRRISELHAVVATVHVGYVQDLRSFLRSSQPAVESVSWFTPAVIKFEPEAGEVEGICKERLGLRIERIDRDGAVAEPFNEERPLVHGQHHARPKVDEKEPCHDHDRTEYKQMLVVHIHHLTSTTGGTVYSPWRMASPGMYTRSQRMNLPEGAGSQLDSCPAGAVF